MVHHCLHWSILTEKFQWNANNTLNMINSNFYFNFTTQSNNLVNCWTYSSRHIFIEIQEMTIETYKIHETILSAFKAEFDGRSISNSTFLNTSNLLKILEDVQQKVLKQKNVLLLNILSCRFVTTIAMSHSDTALVDCRNSTVLFHQWQNIEQGSWWPHLSKRSLCNLICDWFCRDYMKCTSALSQIKNTNIKIESTMK